MIILSMCREGLPYLNNKSVLLILIMEIIMMQVLKIDIQESYKFTTN